MDKDWLESMARLHDMLGQHDRTPFIYKTEGKEMSIRDCLNAIADNWLAAAENVR